MDNTDLFHLYMELLDEAQNIVDGAVPPEKAVELEYALAKFLCYKIMPIITEEREKAKRYYKLMGTMVETIDRLDNKITMIQHKVITTCKKCNGTGVLRDKEQSTVGNDVMKNCHKCVERVMLDEPLPEE